MIMHERGTALPPSRGSTRYLAIRGPTMLEDCSSSLKKLDDQHHHRDNQQQMH